MNNLIDVSILVGILLLGLVVVGLIIARLYRRSSKEMAFVRTGMGGQKVIMDGGALVLPVFHEIMQVNMNTLKLEVARAGKDSLFTRDRMRVDVVAGFFVRVIPSVEGIANAAQTLGQRTMAPDSLRELVEDKFVDSLRAAAVSMTMQELLDKRQDFIQAVQHAVAEDLLKNGLELESVSLTRVDQTPMNFFDPNNAFDAEGLTKLTEATQLRAKQRNEIEQNTSVEIAQKNYEAINQRLSIDREQTFATLSQQQEVATRTAQQKAEVAAIEAQRDREAQQATIEAERLVREAQVEKERAIKQRQIEAERDVQVAQIEQVKRTTLAEQEKMTAIAERSKAQSEAERDANEARALAARAEEQVKTAREVAIADREKQIALVAAEQEAQQEAIGVKVAAEAERDAADNQAQAVRIKAEADRVRFEVEASGIRMRNESLNTLGAEQVMLQIKQALIAALPGIIEASVKPMEKIDGIKIVQVDGLNRGHAGNGQAPATGNLAEQAVSAALAYRAQQPILDAVLGEIGMKGDSLANLVNGVKADLTASTVLPTGPAPDSSH
ncbi:flotillin family protein [Rhodanobacter sp. FDAARGOS 1247]|uniref:flotillin family protein n=1 Tax=Rhodanobacter sp. FDAARGOS 1247 TaxID=2778082 RepID=UPI00194EDEF9|nr:flotillin family protein [Rhodanobacter sp. FDAARGOS 1247]QRP64611.1 flotillin family protein [Rhodanobacter sp. FDAARGOS 1247]